MTHPDTRAKVLASTTPKWCNGEPYYCKACGAGGSEYYGCEQPDCELESKEDAIKRRDAQANNPLPTEHKPDAPSLPSEAQVNSACMSYRHDFGLLSPDERKSVQFEAREWLHAWLKEGIGSDRNEVIERCAAVVDQANREGPYQAIAAASRIRALKDATNGEKL